MSYLSAELVTLAGARGRESALRQMESQPGKMGRTMEAERVLWGTAGR